MRKFGQAIISELGERSIHPTFAIPGGVNRTLSPEGRDRILAQLDDQIATTQLGIKIVKDWAEANAETVQKFAVFPTGYLGLITPHNSLELYDGDIRLKDRNGLELEKFSAQNYLDFIAEHVEPWSYLKFPYYKKLGFPEGAYRVGPLGRINLAEQIDTPLANDELKLFKAINNGAPVENTLLYHYARMIEALFACERVRILLEDPDILSNDILNTRRSCRTRCGHHRAPRGTLIHDYYVMNLGRCRR